MNPQGPNDPNQGPDPLGGGQPPNNYPPQGQQPGQSGWPQQPQQPPGSGWPQQPPPGQYGQQPPPGQYGQQPPPGQYGQQPPPGGQWPPNPNYQQPGYNQGGYYPETVNADQILILGILGIVCCGICAIVAWIQGNNAIAAIDSGRADPSQRSKVNAGRICGIVGVVLMIVGIIFRVALMGMNHGSSSSPFGF